MQILTPSLSSNSTNSLSRAESERDSIYQKFTEAALELDVKVVILKSAPFTFPPWVSIESWVPHQKDPLATIRSRVAIFSEPRDFHKFPVESTVELTTNGTPRRWPGVIDFQSKNALAILNYLTCKSNSTSFGLRQIRLSPLHFWRPQNKLERATQDPLGILSTALCVAFFFSLPFFPIGSFLILAGFTACIFAKTKRRRLTISSGTPKHEPRNLVRLDSWQAVVMGLGPVRESIKIEITQTLTSNSDSTVTIADETTTLWGVDGWENRQQIAIKFRRGLLFLKIYSYNTDLYLGWEAYVNCGSWVEKIQKVGFDEKTKSPCVFTSLNSDWHTPNDYDIADTTSLLERVHSIVIKVIKIKLNQFQLQQEIDFSILREQRHNVTGKSPAEPPKRSLNPFKRVS